MAEITRSLEDVSGNTYAEAATGVPKPQIRKDYPFILFVHQGKEERKVMSKQTWTVLSKKLMETCVNLELEGEICVNSDWATFSRGSGIIATLDESSMKAMKDIVEKTKVADLDFRAWSKGEKGLYTYLSTKLPAMFEKLPAGKVMALICRKNNLPEDGFTIQKCHLQKVNPQRFLKIGVTDSFLAELEKLDMRVCVGYSSLTFSVSV